MGSAALIELAIKLVPLIFTAIEDYRRAEAEKRPLTAKESMHVAAAKAAAAAHATVMAGGIPASAADAPHGPVFG